ncbi:hypothetical protein [Pseudomonas gingeri]
MDRLSKVGEHVDLGAKDFRLIITLGALAFLSLVLIFLLYRYHFSGGFSMDSGEWSDFGGYFGGVLGPIVSVLTLVTVFKTVLLQREMIRIQNETFVSQTTQAKLISQEAAQARLDNRKSMLLSVVDRMVASTLRDISMLNGLKVEQMQSLSNYRDQERLSEAGEDLRKLGDRISELLAKRLQLDGLLTHLAITQYEDLETLQSDFFTRLSIIYPQPEGPLQ